MQFIYILKRVFFLNILACTENALIDEIRHKEHRYTRFEIPKSNGIRTIYAIERGSILCTLQKNLCKYFLAKIDLPTCVKGFVPGGSYKDFLTEHCGSKYFLRIDKKNFFPSITEESIKDTFAPYIKSPDEKERILDFIVSIVTLDGHLPQGAVTSPTVSNIVFYRLDQRILKYCQALGIKYTRYADDLLFSEADVHIPKLHKAWFLKKIRYILSSKDFSLNYNKLKRNSNELVLNGFVIGKELRFSRRRFTDISAVTAFSLNHIGLLENNAPQFLQAANLLNLKDRDLAKYPFSSKTAFIQYLCGYRAYYIGWLGDVDFKTERRIKKTIRKIDGVIAKME